MTGTQRMVGRLSEVQVIAKAVARVANGEGGTILVGGEAGIGKTTLVNHVLQSCAETSLSSIPCRCLGPGETIPYGPWREAFLNLQMRGGRWDPSLLPAPFGSAPALADSFEVALSLIRWLQNAEGPLVIIIDDLQWSDRASMDLLRHLSGRLHGVPLLVIGVYRSEDLHRSTEMHRYFSDMLRTGSQRILLQELNRAEVEELTRVTIPHLDSPSRLANEVYRLTHGFPLFVAEILEQFKGGQHVTVPLSETVQQAIDSKLNLLAPTYVPILEEAAQIGELFSYRLLADISISTQEAVTAALGDAKRLGIIRNMDDQPDMFQFRHAIVRSHLMDRMLGIQLVRCHQTIAEVLERTSPDAIDAIAFHYRRANDPRSVQFLVIAGDQALHIGAILDAEERYRQALESTPKGGPMHAEILLKLGFCMQRRNGTDAVRYFETALDAGRQSEDLPVEAWVRHLLYERAYFRGDRVVLDDIAALLTLQEQLLTNERYIKLEQLFFRGHCEYPRIVTVYWSFLYTHGRLEEAEQLLNDLQTRVGTHHPQVLRMKTRLSAFLGRLDETIATARELSKAAYQQHDDWSATILFANYLYHTYLSKTDQPDKVDAVIQELLLLENEINGKNGLGFMPKDYSASGFYHYTRGNWAEGHKHLSEYVLAESEPDPLITWFAAVMLVETGDNEHLDAVLSKLAPFRPADPPSPSTTVFIWVHAIRAQAHLLRNEVELAKAWLDAADVHPLSQVSKLHRPLLDIAWSDYYRQTEDQTRAIEACERALTWAESVPIPWFVIKARRRFGELQGEHSQYTEAFKLLEDSAALAETCRLPYETALCHLSTGRVWRMFETTAEITDHSEVAARRGAVVKSLQTALDVFTRLGAREQAETERLLDGVHAAAKAVIASTSRAVSDVLTKREWEVARLVAEGLTDKEVAAKLYVSPRTVDHHLRNIFRKLDVRHRAALAAHLMKQEV
ncbi:AAA family ATPase [Fodinisporobacter ferrooxydans]|uniref:AAA family ATPase n=1 Tax=Fodinisporobacter ferrooxydans TaxID=2901836 RepID=A0ABY4CNL7_9BACL|nr:AAA family ATPase [Alicyclobacillaceae bacterium MYW30-H2]